MEQHKLTVYRDAFGEIVAYDPTKVIAATWEKKKLRLWFSGEYMPIVVLDGAVAQSAWEELVTLRGGEDVRDR